MGIINYTTASGHALGRQLVQGEPSRVVKFSDKQLDDMAKAGGIGNYVNMNMVVAAVDEELTGEIILRQAGEDAYECRIYRDPIPQYYGTIHLSADEPKPIDPLTCHHRFRNEQGYVQCGLCKVKVSEQWVRSLTGDTSVAMRQADKMGELQRINATLNAENLDLRLHVDILERKLSSRPRSSEPLVGSTWKRRPI